LALGTQDVAINESKVLALENGVINAIATTTEIDGDIWCWCREHYGAKAEEGESEETHCVCVEGVEGVRVRSNEICLCGLDSVFLIYR